MENPLKPHSKSRRFNRLCREAQDLGFGLYKVWGGYQVTDNKPFGLDKEISCLDDVEEYMSKVEVCISCTADCSFAGKTKKDGINPRTKCSHHENNRKSELTESEAE